MQVRKLPGLLSVLVMKNYRGNVKLVNTLKRKIRFKNDPDGVLFVFGGKFTGLC